MRRKYIYAGLLSVILLSGCVSKEIANQKDAHYSDINSFRSPASKNEGPLRIIFIGPKATSIQVMKQLSEKECLVQGMRGTESLNKERGQGFGYDNDRNGYINDRYGWQFGPNLNKPVFSLAPEINLAGDYEMFGRNSHQSPTQCAVIFPVFFENKESMSEALNYLVKSSDVLHAYIGPVVIYYSTASAMRSALFKALSGANMSGLTKLSLIPLD